VGGGVPEAIYIRLLVRFLAHNRSTPNDGIRL
jgi:hypothetical protein